MAVGKNPKDHNQTFGSRARWRQTNLIQGLDPRDTLIPRPLQVRLSSDTGTVEMNTRYTGQHGPFRTDMPGLGEARIRRVTSTH